MDMSEGTGASGVETRALLLAVRGLCVDRPDGSPLLVDVGLELRAREVVAVFGASGRMGQGTTVTIRVPAHAPE